MIDKGGNSERMRKGERLRDRDNDKGQELGRTKDGEGERKKRNMGRL